MEFWMRLEKEHPVACGMFYGTIITMIMSLMIISLVALTLQKLILQRYADEHFFLNTRFFVDDGFSEVSFEREGLQAMLRKVVAENVATVIAKDDCVILELNIESPQRCGFCDVSSIF